MEMNESDHTQRTFTGCAARWVWMSHDTHRHLEGGQLLGVDDSLVNCVGLRQVDHFAERGSKIEH